MYLHNFLLICDLEYTISLCLSSSLLTAFKEGSLVQTQCLLKLVLIFLSSNQLLQFRCYFWPGLCTLFPCCAHTHPTKEHKKKLIPFRPDISHPFCIRNHKCFLKSGGKIFSWLILYYTFSAFFSFGWWADKIISVVWNRTTDLVTPLKFFSAFDSEDMWRQ